MRSGTQGRCAEPKIQIPYIIDDLWQQLGGGSAAKPVRAMRSAKLHDNVVDSKAPWPPSFHQPPFVLPLHHFLAATGVLSAHHSSPFVLRD